MSEETSPAPNQAREEPDNEPVTDEEQDQESQDSQGSRTPTEELTEPPSQELSNESTMSGAWPSPTPTPRTRGDAMPTNSVTSRDNRKGLQEKQMFNLELNATKSLESKFFGISSKDFKTVDHNELAKTMNLSVLMSNFRGKLNRYDMGKIFFKFPVLDFSSSDETKWWESRKTIDLLAKTDSLDVAVIAKTVRWMRLYLPDAEMLRELNWTDLLLQNSCDRDSENDIYSQVTVTLATYHTSDELYSGGPLTFAVIMSALQNVSAKLLEQLWKAIEDLDIKSYQGENVEVICSQIRAVVTRLNSCDAQDFTMPMNYMEKLLKVFTTSSVEEFNGIFAHLGNTLKASILPGSSGLPGFDLERVLTLAVQNYRSLSDVWNVTNTGKSSMFQGRFGGGEDRTCYQCNQPGHLSNSDLCPLKGKSPAPGSRNANNGGRGGGGRNGGRFGGRGGGRSGGRGSHGRNNNPVDPMIRNPDPSVDTKTVANVISRWTTKINGTVHRWCGKCTIGTQTGRWTNGRRIHFTDEHSGGGNPIANLAGTQIDANDSASVQSSGTTPGTSFSRAVMNGMSQAAHGSE